MIGRFAATRFGKYEIIAPLGVGGMACVYLAYDSSLDREVAIKVLRGAALDDEVRARFLQEARATANLSHPNIITIFEVDEHDGQPFIAMEYVAGPSLATLVARQEPMPLADKLRYIEQICTGLEIAHGAGIVHRDIKPGNVMVDARGVIRILDFGIARLAGSAMTIDGALLGTINYMSPEQMLGKRVDFRSDIFGVGAVAYELITCCQAFPGTLEELLHALPTEPPVRMRQLCPDLDAEIEAIVFRALEKNPHHRFANLSEMRVALAAARSRFEAIRGAGFVVATPAAASVVPATLPVRRTRDLASTTDEIRRQLRAAAKHLTAGEAARAAELARSVIEHDPSSVEAHAVLVKAHRALLHDRERGSTRLRRTRRRAVAGAATAIALAASATIWKATSGRVDPSHPALPPAPTKPPFAAALGRDPRPLPDDWSLAPKVPIHVTPPPAVERDSAGPTRSHTTDSREPVPSPGESTTERKSENEGAREPAPAPPLVTSIPPVTSSPLARETPAIEAALNRYRLAHQKRDINALKAVYPTLDREVVQAKVRQFKDRKGCKEIDIRFENPSITLTPDETKAYVSVSSTYVCTPVTGQAQAQRPVADLFELEKNGDGWSITRINLMGGSGQR